MQKVIDALIKKYLSENNIVKYDIQTGFWNYEDWATPLKLGNNVAFVCEMNVIVAIDNVDDFSKGLFIIESENQKVDYKQLVKAIDIAGAVQLSSDFISIHHTELKLTESSPSIYSKIYTGHFKYVILSNIKRKVCSS